ncbi:hypothetical protein Plano_2078 [Planococcus sp. PAMC 21323]|nr:hypothetical protein Plano_2078 [Planococcus sp. PAMC 21323]
MDVELVTRFIISCSSGNVKLLEILANEEKFAHLFDLDFLFFKKDCRWANRGIK